VSMRYARSMSARTATMRSVPWGSLKPAAGLRVADRSTEPIATAVGTPCRSTSAPWREAVGHDRPGRASARASAARGWRSPTFAWSVPAGNSAGRRHGLAARRPLGRLPAVPLASLATGHSGVWRSHLHVADWFTDCGTGGGRARRISPTRRDGRGNPFAILARGGPGGHAALRQVAIAHPVGRSGAEVYCC